VDTPSNNDLAKNCSFIESRMEEKIKLRTEQTKGELAEILVELLRTNGKVVSAIYDCVCRCPNLVVEY
jgi:hypothetical protein